MSSARAGHEATNCIDGNKTALSTMCHDSCLEKAPWIALLFYGPVEVSRVDIYNNEIPGASITRNVEVKLTDELPASAHQMYAGGQLLGTFQGPNFPEINQIKSNNSRDQHQTDK